MKIHGIEISEEAIQSCEIRMMEAPFRASDITLMAEVMGVPNQANREYISNRVADRLIQKHRKKGNISLQKGAPIWTWIGGNP